MNDEDTVQTRRFGQNCAAQSSQMTSDDDDLSQTNKIYLRKLWRRL